ncbi:MAG: FHA domain-containing protein [Myxococcaceae bacterium]
MTTWRLTFDCEAHGKPVQRVVVEVAEGVRCIIGRSRGATVWVDSAAIAREHCSMTVTGGHATIEDHGSAGGTFLNRARIRGPTPLKPGDVFFPGQPKLTFVSIEPV